MTLGRAQRVLGLVADALETHRTAVRQYRQLLGDEHHFTWEAEVALASSELASDRWEYAESLYERALPRIQARRGWRAALAPDLAGHAEALALLGRCEAGRARFAEARMLADSAPDAAYVVGVAMERAERALETCVDA